MLHMLGHFAMVICLQADAAIVLSCAGSRLLIRVINSTTNSALQAGLNAARVLIFWLGVFIAVKLVLDTT